MAKKRTGGTGLGRGMADASRDTLEQARKASGQKMPAKAGKYHRKSYLLTLDLIEAIKLTAQHHGVGINEFVRWALIYVLNGLEDGSIELPVEEEVKRRIKF